VLAMVALPCKAGLIFVRRRLESDADRERRSRERKRIENRAEQSDDMALRMCMRKERGGKEVVRERERF
jgi:hypothetical protein